ncbi:MAG: LysM peptidoglycan-binding domain-containing protein [Rickettsiales bacterium]|jgi:murein DD-endopeptidase MepM/ murein hydrolase activator NlpD|nr:LysM peptidoglycan-binding domain-containing protein [Rickettsiales bacterium]
MKKIFLLIFSLAVASCSQDPARITYKEKGTGIGKMNSLKPSYVKGDYVRTKGDRVVRDLNKVSDRSNIDEDDDFDQDGSSFGHNSGNIVFYTVRPGDNLYRIAYKNNINFTDLVRNNSLKKPYELHVGQRLILKPGTTGDGDSGRNRNTGNSHSEYNTKNMTSYTVKPGDNLYRIAYRNNMNFVDLAKSNNLKKPYDLQVGQKLLLESKKFDDQATDSISSGKKATLDGQGLERVETRESIPVGDNSGNFDKMGNNFIWPVEGEIIKDPKKQINGNSSDSINIKASLGTKIKSIANGEVAYAGDELKGFGKIIILKHEGGWISVYGHCESIAVKVKDMVQKGQVIGAVGETGNIGEPQLYFSLRKGRIAVDPTKYLSRR